MKYIFYKSLIFLWKIIPAVTIAILFFAMLVIIVSLLFVMSTIASIFCGKIITKPVRETSIYLFRFLTQYKMDVFETPPLFSKEIPKTFFKKKENNLF